MSEHVPLIELYICTVFHKHGMKYHRSENECPNQGSEEKKRKVKSVLEVLEKSENESNLFSGKVIKKV